MIGWIKRIFVSQCALCKRKVSKPRHYINDKGKTIKVCHNCAVYAERRAFRKVWG